VADARLRLFIGVALDDTTRAAIERALQAGTGSAPVGMRFLQPDNWHFTLQFLGAVAEDGAVAVRAACRDTASQAAPFDIELGRVGAFKSARSARVVWIGLAHGAGPMAALYEALLAHTERLGFAREARPFAAHLTVARLKEPADVTRLLASTSIPALRMRVAQLTLFRSHLSPKGARYEVLERYALAG
jgi:2'-5' RNA ligase